MKAQYKISVCCYNDGLAELTYERLSDNKSCTIMVDLEEDQIEFLTEVIGPCVYYGATDNAPYKCSCGERLHENQLIQVWEEDGESYSSNCPKCGKTLDEYWVTQDERWRCT